MDIKAHHISAEDQNTTDKSTSGVHISNRRMLGPGDTGRETHEILKREHRRKVPFQKVAKVALIGPRRRRGEEEDKEGERRKGWRKS